MAKKPNINAMATILVIDTYCGVLELVWSFPILRRSMFLFDHFDVFTWVHSWGTLETGIEYELNTFNAFHFTALKYDPHYMTTALC